MNGDTAEMAASFADAFASRFKDILNSLGEDDARDLQQWFVRRMQDRQGAAPSTTEVVEAVLLLKVDALAEADADFLGQSLKMLRGEACLIEVPSARRHEQSSLGH